MQLTTLVFVLIFAVAYLALVAGRAGVALLRQAHAQEAIAEDLRRLAASSAQVAGVELPVLIAAITELSEAVDRSGQTIHIDYPN